MEKLASVATDPQSLHRCPELNPAILVLAEHLRTKPRQVSRFRFPVEIMEKALPQTIVDGAAVIRINQAQIPQLGPLIDVRITG